LIRFRSGDGVVFEGVGRSLEEARLFEEVTKWLSIPYIVVDLEVSDEEATRRAEKRKVTEMREDDHYVPTRLLNYRNISAPVFDYFLSIGKAVRISGIGSEEDIHKEIMRIIEETALKLK
ncbi:hypothetical protein L0Y49_04740, partial [bacterium]|nr:hypothetical protein [bacterium]